LSDDTVDQLEKRPTFSKTWEKMFCHLHSVHKWWAHELLSIQNVVASVLSRCQWSFNNTRLYV